MTTYEHVLPRLPILSRDRGFSITAMEEQGLRLAGTVEIGRGSHHLPPPEEAPASSTVSVWIGVE